MATDPDCLFCKIIAGEIPSTRVYEDERTIAFMDINPGTTGHLLVVPRAHAKDLLEIEPEDLAAVARTGQVLAQRVSNAVAPPPCTCIASPPLGPDAPTGRN